MDTVDLVLVIREDTVTLIKTREAQNGGES